MAKRGRKSNAEKAAQAEQQPATEVVSNKTVSQVIFNKHREAILEAIALKDSAVANLRNARKDAEKDGLDPKDFDLLAKLEKLDPLTRKKRLANVVLYANWIDLPLGFQASFHDAPGFDAEPKSEKAPNPHAAYQHGYEARKGGIARDRNAYPKGNDAELWSNGWDDAERDIASGKLQPTAAAA